MTSLKWESISKEIETTNCGSLRESIREFCELSLYLRLCGDDGAWGVELEEGVWVPMEVSFAELE